MRTAGFRGNPRQLLGTATAPGEVWMWMLWTTSCGELSAVPRGREPRGAVPPGRGSGLMVTGEEMAQPRILIECSGGGG